MFLSVRDCLLLFSEKRPHLSLGDVSLDGQLSGSINSSGIVEICGPRNSGKTTLVFQIVLDFLVRYPEKKVLFANSNPNFSLKRLCEIYTSRYGSNGWSDIVERLILTMNPQDFGCLSDFYVIFQKLNEPSFGLLVVDSITGKFRNCDWDRSKSFELIEISCLLNKICREKIIPVICINEEKTFEISSGIHENIACLGLSWLNGISTRIRISRTRQSHYINEKEVARSISIKFSSLFTENPKLVCQITKEGFTTLA